MYRVSFYTKSGNSVEFDEITFVKVFNGELKMHDIDNTCLMADMKKIESVHIEHMEEDND